MDGQRRALIIANDVYEHEGLRHLLAPAADAAALADVLGDPKIGDFDVEVVLNESAHVVQGQIEELLLEARPDDVLLLHFSCHGLKSDSGELFFAVRNTRPNRLGSTAIPADFVQRCMRSSRSRRIVLLLDCCYGGAFGKGVAVRSPGEVNVLDSFSGQKLGGGRGRAVITASTSMEYAFEGDRLADDSGQDPSVFTSALVEGLVTGDADRDEDGWVSLNELYDYVFDRVRAENPHQTPSRDIEMTGELYLARSRRMRIRPLPIPTDLQAAISDHNIYSRLGAVAELRSRLASDDLPVASGAYEALRGVARTDIKQVADTAAAAIREVSLNVDESRVDFGQAVIGTELQRTIGLSGAPLTRACRFQVSDRWINVEDVPGGIEICVDSSRVGRLDGSISLTSPTGRAVIRVSAEVVDAPATAHPGDSAPSSLGHDELDIGSGSDSQPSVVTPVDPAPAAIAATLDAPVGAESAAESVAGERDETPHDAEGTADESRDNKVGRRRMSSIVWALMPALSLGVLTPVPSAMAASRLGGVHHALVALGFTVTWILTILMLWNAIDVAPLWWALSAMATAHALWLRGRVFSRSVTSR
jgi:hypothetical protein